MIFFYFEGFEIFEIESIFLNPLSGRREIVGYGFNGMHNYVDRYDYPFPAIRFKEDTAEILGLKTKEKGDWKSMTLDEKKTCKC